MKLHPQPSPADLGYRMPAEWEPHAATWLAWPHNADDWPGRFDAIPAVYDEMVRHLSQAENVEILVQDAAAATAVGERLERAGAALARVRLHAIPTDRSWTRDCLPIFLVGEGRGAAVKWCFNGWARYDDWRRDDAAGGEVARLTDLPVFTPERETVPGGSGEHSRDKQGGNAPGRIPLVLEGGSIDVDGAGLLLATEECLLSPVQERNPGVGREEMEEILRVFLGARKILWLGCGILGDDTHGHVDDLARFVAPGRVVAVQEEDPADPNHEILADNLRRLQSMTDLAGRPLEIITLPMPARRFLNGEPLPASYANFYAANGLVLVPTFKDPRDAGVLETLAGLFPGRRVVGIDAVDLLLGQGTIHCSTQQQPV